MHSIFSFLKKFIRAQALQKLSIISYMVVEDVFVKQMHSS